MVTYLGYGTYILKTTSVPTASFDLTGKSEGVDYIKLVNTPKRAVAVSYDTGVAGLPAGSAYAVNLGQFQEMVTITDVASETTAGYIEKFCQTHAQPATSSYLYMVVVTASGSPPTVKSFYKNSATGTAYMPVRIASLSLIWDEDNQFYNVNIGLEACWT